MANPTSTSEALALVGRLRANAQTRASQDRGLDAAETAAMGRELRNLSHMITQLISDRDQAERKLALVTKARRLPTVNPQVAEA